MAPVAFYRDSESGLPIVFSNGGPLPADAFEEQMFFVVKSGAASLFTTIYYS